MAAAFDVIGSQQVRAAIAIAIVVAIGAGESRARAYDFEIRARTIGQGYELRSLRLLGSDVLLDRRRYTQTLTLNIWDLNGRLTDRKLYETSLVGGPRLYITTYMRVDHDFGSWTTGDLIMGNQVIDALDLTPELESSSLSLDVLYGYFAAEDLLGGVLDVHLGRQLSVDTLDWWSMDGVTVNVDTPLHVAIEAFGGLRVRDESPFGSDVQELDGTGSSECAEYVEGGLPGTGAWRPIDRVVPGSDNPFSSDFDVCPQREQLVPTFGGAIETIDLGAVWARVAYRKSVSKTPGVIGLVDRFEFDDVGLYPNEIGQAPDWGVNEERLSATVRANIWFAKGKGRVTPYAAARYSALHGLIDEGHAGARFRYGAHSVEPEVFYSFPTFDGDSIFNVFSTQPYTDVRATYDLHRDDSPVRAYLRGWWRSYGVEDADLEQPLGDVDVSTTAAGVQIGASYVQRRDLLARIDLFHDDGYGGRRTGGYGSLRWQASEQTGLSSRVSVIDFDDGVIRDLDGTTLGVQLGATYVVNEGVTLHVLAEENTNRFYTSQFRLIGVMDLAFRPET